MNAAHEAALQRVRHRVRDSEAASPRASASVRDSCTRPVRATRAAPTAACSCRSPATTRSDLPVPGQRYTFGLVKAAQARGDFQVLARAQPPRAPGPLGSDVAAGLRTLDAAIDATAACA